VPIAALQGEQANTKAAREQAAQYRMALEMHGFTIGQDGTVTPPQPTQTPPQTQPTYQPPSPPAQVQYGPQTQSLAERLGIRPEELTGVIQEAAGPIAQAYGGPMAEGIGTVYEQVLRQDPYWDVVKDEYHNIVKTLVPQQLKGHPATLMQAFEMAKGRKTEAIATKMAEARANPGQTVGRFTEGAAPGIGGPNTQLPQDTDNLADKWGLTPEQKARVAQRISNRRR
jgi:hypothetical protein